MLKKITIITIASFFALILFEIFLKYSPFEYGTSPVIYDKEIGMWHKKNFSGYTIKECYKTKFIFDNKGLPKSIYNYDKNKKDIVILGDSLIEAIMVKNKNIIHNSLAKEFNNKYNFLNYGLSGSSPVQQFIILKNKIDLSNVKYVIHFVNLDGDLRDVDKKNLNKLARPKVYIEFKTLNDYKIIPPRKKNLYDTFGDLLGDYQIYFFIKKSLYYIQNNILKTQHQIHNKKDISISHIKDTTTSKHSLINMQKLSKNWLYLQGAIHQIKKYIKSINNKTIYKIIVISKNSKNIEIIKKFLNKEKIEFVILNEIANKTGISLNGFSCDKHWNDKTHQQIAKLIKDIKFIK